MVLTVYAFSISQPARAVIWLLEIKNATYNLKVTRPHTDTENPEYYNIAPTGRIPAIDDDGFKLIESHAILEYLCDKNGWGDYYPRDAATRATISQYLHWHHANMRRVTLDVWGPIFFAVIRKQKVPSVVDPLPSDVAFALQLFDVFFLKDKKFIAGGDQPTIADHCHLGVL